VFRYHGLFVFVVIGLSGICYDGTVEGLVRVHVHVDLDRGSVHVCHDVSVASIGFQHKAVLGGAAKTDGTDGDLDGDCLRLVFRGWETGGRTTHKGWMDGPGTRGLPFASSSRPRVFFPISFSLARGSGFGFECVRKVRPRASLTDVVSKIPRFVETQHTTRDTTDSRLQRCRN
jgi:hypothetical protein